MKTRVIVYAKTGPDKWRDYLGMPRQYVSFCGVPLVQRTVAMARSFGMVSEVFVTGTPPAGVRIVGAEMGGRFRDVPFSDGGDPRGLDCLTDDPEDCTVFLYGDIYYSFFCLQNVFVSAAMNQGGTLGLHYFGRRGGGHNGKDWGEVFAWSMKGTAARATWKMAVALAVARAEAAGTGGQRTTWEVLDFLVQGRDYYWTEIRDETEDFDYPEDHQKWTKLYPHLWAAAEAAH